VIAYYRIRARLLAAQKEPELKWTNKETEHCYDSDDNVEDVDWGICQFCEEKVMVAHMEGSKKNICFDCMEGTEAWSPFDC